MIQPDASGLYHPASEADITELITYAVQNKLEVRARGASQSVATAIFTDGYVTGNNPGNNSNNINLMLDKMRDVLSVNKTTMQVTVQAGCNLGFDPYDPSHSSNNTNGLFVQLQANGLAIPNMSDAIHQTIAGFISTGSSGGSIAHSFVEAIISITLVDGTGKVQVLNKPNPENPNDPFYAAGVSLGLLGIITQVTLQCIPSFNVIGMQSITPDTQAPLDFFGPGSASLPSLQTYLENTEFTRLLWWPYPTFKRLVTWQARTMLPGDYNAHTGTPQDFKPKPYKDVFPSVLGSEIPSESMADAFFSLIGNWQQAVTDLFGNEIQIGGKNIPTEYLKLFIQAIWPFLLPRLLSFYFPLDGTKPPQQFWDVWLNALPMDDHEYSNKLFPAFHAEFVVPVTQSQQVMMMLDKYYTNDYFASSNSANNNYANGCYVVEVFGAKNSSFWLSPSYNQDSVRINFFSFLHNNEDVLAYYQQFWDLFKNNNINFRPHWGYYLPPPTGNEGAAYITGQYPLWNQFASLRNTMDPDNIFLTDYWRSQLNIPNTNGNG